MMCDYVTKLNVTDVIARYTACAYSWCCWYARLQPNISVKNVSKFL